MLPERNLSLWADSVNRGRFETLNKNLDIDVAIIGGGFSGLWSAFHLISGDPTLKIALFEAHHIGFGASGRNGGWLSADYPVSRNTLIKRIGEEGTDSIFTALKSSIDEVGNFARDFAPTASFTKGGSITFARNSAQAIRLRNSVDEDHHWLSNSELTEKILIADSICGVHTKSSAVVNPMELLLGLAKYLTKKGVAIYENSAATIAETGRLLVGSYFVTAPRVINAVEAFRSAPREQIPLYSLMVATEPLTSQFWSEVGNFERATFAEGSHLINYAQRTSDNRLAIGGRGARYPFASKRSTNIENSAKTHEALRALAKSWFPQLSKVRFTHAWGGAIAITRDWEPYLRWDKNRGYGELGGYAGDGMTMSYLAGKAMAAEILDNTSSIRTLRFVNRRSRNWEFEPLRFAAINSLIKLTDLSDAEERLTRKPSLINRIIEPLILR
ncbi:unannotated protein [freshwater metagenome]|uniref:Unannotated protein n=1 Tax=freshwater metagenome TaxID=449393 RepID=A0A6J6FM81_9ZZZZ|nr:FAD-dependent oxidoreductase [Actinomycetota bacterium]